MFSQISSRIEAAHSVMTHGHDRGVLRPRLHDLLRQALIDEDASGHARDREFLRRPDIDQFDLAAFQQLGSFARRDLQIFFHFLAPLDVFDEFIDVQPVIHGHGREQIRRLEAATAATTDVIALKQRALRGRKHGRHLLHCPRAG